MVRRHGFVAFFQEIDLIRAVDEAEVCDGVDEFLWIVHHALGDRVAPELAGVFELLEDFDDIGGIDGTIGLALRRVAELADAGVASPGVVPSVRAFL